MKALFVLALAVGLVVVACQGETVVEVVATPASLPTPAPWPTHTPYPTPAPLPTHTPFPTYTPFPSRTPFLTPAVAQDKWVVYLSGTSKSLVLAGADSGSLWGPWTLSLSCDPEERPAFYLNRVDMHIFDLDTAEAVEPVLIDLDGVVSVQWDFADPPPVNWPTRLIKAVRFRPKAVVPSPPSPANAPSAGPRSSACVRSGSDRRK